MAKKKITLEDLKEQRGGSHNRGQSHNGRSHRRNPGNRNDRGNHDGPVRHFVPRDTNRKFAANLVPDNFALFLNKKIPIIQKQDKYQFSFPIDQVTRQTPGFVKYYEALKKLFSIEISYLELETDWKLSIGLGGASVYETGITLHHIYGIPYIPGSTIKGSVRSYVILTQFDGNEQAALEDNEFINIFGSQDQQGKVLFFDAFAQNLTIKSDILNPHYKDYYAPAGNPQPPADYIDPVPISFLTVEGTFKFAIGCRHEHRDLLETTSRYLRATLTQYGLGAKTAVGYGYFK